MQISNSIFQTEDSDKIQMSFSEKSPMFFF